MNENNPLLSEKEREIASIIAKKEREEYLKK